jgi:hypothetical protein
VAIINYRLHPLVSPAQGQVPTLIMPQSGCVVVRGAERVGDEVFAFSFCKENRGRGR